MNFRSYQNFSFRTPLQYRPDNIVNNRSFEEIETRVTAFINALTPQSFAQEVSQLPSASSVPPSAIIPNTVPENYLLICLKIDDSGFHYQILEPVFFNPLAYCIVSKSVMSFPVANDLLEEIKSMLLEAFLKGVCFEIKEITPKVGSEVGAEASTELTLLKNVSFLGQAVDIVKLDPVNLVGTMQSISAIDYSFNEQTAVPSADGRYGMPPGTQMTPNYSQDVNMDTSVFEERTSFVQKFSETVSLNIPFPPLSGVSNGDSKQVYVKQGHRFPSYTPTLVDIIKKYKRSAKILINKINFSNIWRNQAKSQILTEGEVRLDLQGLDSTKFNYQLQVGSHTISAVLIDRNIADIKIDSERAYAVRKIKSGFQQSLDDCCIYRVSFKNTFLTLGSENDDALGGENESQSDADSQEHSGSLDSAFSASFTYSFVSESTRDAKNTVTHSTATHTLYTLRQSISYDPKLIKLNDDFRFWIEKRLSADKPETLDLFIKEVGTHYTTSVTFGGVGFQMLKISYQAVEELQEKNISISTAAADALLSQNTSLDTRQGYSTYDTKTTAQTVCLGGTVLPTIDPQEHRLNFKDWSESVPEEPVPVQIKVSPLSDLLTSEFFPDMDQSVLQKLRLALSQAVIKYLADNKPKPTPVKRIITSCQTSTNGKFILVAANASSKVIGTLYWDYWSSIPYLFATLESYLDNATVFFLSCTNDSSIKENIVHNNRYHLCSDKLADGIFEGTPYDAAYSALAFYGGWPQAYFDTTQSADDRTSWIIEKLNTSEDLIIRDGDEVRFRHVSSGELLASTPLDDAHNTLTRTWDGHDQYAVFIIKLIS